MTYVIKSIEGDHELEATVQFDKHAITVTTKSGISMSDMLELINKCEFELQEFYPKDWQFIMVDEDYGTFAALGSPQVMESCWKFEYYTEAYFTRLTITGLEQA